MKALITGSLAYDTIMVFEDKFRNHILPDQMHILNVCFFTPSMRREFGGCAGNIAYTLKLLGGEPKILATCGEDFEPYANWLQKKQIDQSTVKTMPGQFTAQAFITTDLDNNQISAFHPGAMNDAHTQTVSEAGEVDLAIIAPDGRDAMLEHAAQLSEANTPFIFDPGQGLPMFEGEEILEFCRQATYVVVNDYESQLMREKTGVEIAELAKMVDAFIITKGSKGSQIIVDDQSMVIEAAPISEAADPTGCGDAYRSGLMFGILKGLDWRTTGQIAALCGAIKVEHHGTQNHDFDLAQFAQRYQDSFGAKLTIN